MPDDNNNPLHEFVKALARRQARIDAADEFRGGDAMPSERPEIRSVNGYDVIKASDAVYKVYDDDRQYGSDFVTFADAAEYALKLPSRGTPGR